MIPIFLFLKNDLNSELFRRAWYYYTIIYIYIFTYLLMYTMYKHNRFHKTQKMVLIFDSMKQYVQHRQQIGRMPFSNTTMANHTHLWRHEK